MRLIRLPRHISNPQATLTSRFHFLDYGGENIDLYMFLKKKFPKIHIIVINQSPLNFHLKKFLKKKKLRNIKVLSNKSKLKNIKFDYATSRYDYY